MTTTATSIAISEPLQPDERPWQVTAHGPADFLSSPDIPAHHGAELPDHGRSTGLEPPSPLPPVSIIVDVNGQYVAEDRLGAAYGVGSSPQAAISDFYDALSRRLALLRRHRDQLHPGLLQELTALEGLFPGR